MTQVSVKVFSSPSLCQLGKGVRWADHLGIGEPLLEMHYVCTIEQSFIPQLAAEFQVRFEAPHVINARTQVWAGSIAAGPDAQSLVATFEQSRKPALQDSLGRSIAAIAGVVPDGLLVFFSSYSMMDRLKERWEVGSLSET